MARCVSHGSCWGIEIRRALEFTSVETILPDGGRRTSWCRNLLLEVRRDGESIPREEIRGLHPDRLFRNNDAEILFLLSRNNIPDHGRNLTCDQETWIHKYATGLEPLVGRCYQCPRSEIPMLVLDGLLFCVTPSLQLRIRSWNAQRVEMEFGWFTPHIFYEVCSI